jgi:murein peptide amidase A
MAGCGLGFDSPSPRVTAGTRAARSPAATRVRIGYSVRGRPLYAEEVGALRRRPADLLVVGCIHGDEPAGVAVVSRLRHELARRRLDAWLVPDLNPDGVDNHTRQNADGVDLNRNFPWRWRQLGPRGSRQYAGPRPLSEPESRAARQLIERIRPHLAIWLHQPLGVVDASDGRLDIERSLSRFAGLPLRRLPRYPGSAVGWENHAITGSSAFVVELAAGPLSARRATAVARAIAALSPS